ncbi:MAG TPA: hypothetical protein PKL52_11860 [Tenuifilaceae bacterium]|nr:hypothetical protein [Tenuifilaceae bacterium]
MNRLTTILILSMALLSGCGKPSDPDLIFDSGGYKVISRFTTPGNPQDVIKHDTLLCFAQGEGGLLIVGIRDVENPTLVSITTESVRGYSRRIAQKGNVVYLSAGTFGLSVVDITNAINPEVTVSNLNVKPAKDITVYGDYLFISTSEQGVRIAEVSNPRTPDIRERTLTNGYANGVAISEDGKYMFVACGEMGVSVFDISNFDEGYGIYPLVSWVDFPGYAESIALCDDRPIAYVASRASGVQVIDFSDINKLSVVGSFETGGVANDLAYTRGKLYVSAQKAGLHILDATNPTNLKRIGWVNSKNAMGFDYDDQYIYLADDSEGLIIIAIPK